MARPDWWEWEFELSDHVLERLAQRRLAEIDLRALLEDAQDVHPDKERGRWAVRLEHEGIEWEAIVEPNDQRKIVRVITIYQAD